MKRGCAWQWVTVRFGMENLPTPRFPGSSLRMERIADKRRRPAIWAAVHFLWRLRAPDGLLRRTPPPVDQTTNIVKIP